MNIFVAPFDLTSILENARANGYVFSPDAIDPEICRALKKESDNLSFENGDHVTYPINKGAHNEVRQMHERVYRPLDHPEVPVANKICHALAQQVTSLSSELAGWIPTEIGYQRYRDTSDWISPHRDRRSDRLLSVTLTITGSAWIRIHESETDPPDYARLHLTDACLTAPGTVMFLRAPGFGSGEQVIHEVSPPQNGERLILNLRMRPTVLKPPSETYWR